MTSTVSRRLLAALCLLGACGKEASDATQSVTSPVTEPAHGARFSPNPVSRYVGSSVGDIAITLTGPSKVLTQSTVTFSTSVTGGTGPYYFIWNEEVCWTDGTCRVYPITKGWGLSSISHQVRSDMVTDDIEVQVGTSDLRMSAIDGRTVLAPGAKYVDSGGNSGLCDREPNYYPFQYWNPNVGSNGDPLSGKHYIRSSCDGSKMFDPSGN